MTKEKQKGFTLIEVLLVAAILGIIAVVAMASWASFSDSTALGNNAKMIEAKIKLAKSYSLSALNDKNYGVHLDAGSLTIFPADAPYNPLGADNQASPLTDGVEIYDGVGNDIVFARLTGATANSGTIGIRIIAKPEKTKTITINSQGQTGIDVFATSPVSPITDSRHIHFRLSAWNIQSKPPVTALIFRKADGTLIESFDTASYFVDGVFDWRDSILIDDTAQRLRVHTLNTDGAVLCIKRDRMWNNKTVKISFMDNGIEKEIVVYTENADGTVTVTPNFAFVNIPVEVQ